MAFIALKVELDIADTADEADDFVGVNGSMNVKARLIGPAGAGATVAFSADPSAKATVSPASTNMTVGTDYDLILTGQQASSAANDADLIATLGECECELEDFTVGGLQAPLQYKIGTNAWAAMPDPLYVAKDTTVDFLAIKTPTNAPSWPAGKPVWGGVVSGSGKETNSYTFNVISTSTSDYKIVTAECGNTVTGKVIVLKVELKSISFIDGGTGNGGDNEHTIYENDDPDEWGDGAAIADPVWIADGSDAGSEPDKNRPVCYTKSTATVQSKVNVDVVVKVEPAGQTFSLVGMDGTTEYFRKDGITSTTGDQTVTNIVASVALPTTLEKLSKTFIWKAIFSVPDPDFECQAAESTHTIYTVYDTPITTVESQDNKPTLKRLDFDIVGVAAGQSNKVTICDKIVEKVRNMTGDSYGGMTENPRWKFYANPPDRDLDCHHRAALAASGFGVVGIQGYVNRVYATCHPVPDAPPGYPVNPTKNDYVGTYTEDRFKYRKPGADIHKLVFNGNNFEGCLRVEDGSADDGNAWWTVWPRQQHDTAKALIIWYDGSYSQRWIKLDWTFVEAVAVPTTELNDKPKLLGGPD